MRFIKSTILLFLVQSCVILGNQHIHSPSAENAVLIRHRDIHVAALKKSPPNLAFMHLTGLDSSAVLVAAKPIDAKNIWGGMVLPVFPLFLIPRRHFYDEKNLLTIYLVPSTAKDLSILMTDIKLYENGEIHTPLNMIYKGDTVSQVSISGEHYDRWLPMFHHIPIQYYPNKLVLNFPVDGGSTEKFELRIKKISSGNKVAQMPLIAFQKKKQRFRFIGP